MGLVIVEVRLAQLMGRVADGDRSALAEMYDALAPAVLRLTRALVGEETQAQQVLIDTFLHVWREAPRRPRGASSTTAWVLEAASRCGVEHRSRRAGSH